MMMCFLILAILAGNRVARSTPVGQEIPLSTSDIQDILDKHNGYRNNVSPTATNLFKLIWDADIAAAALTLAKTCILQHDTASDRSVSSLPGVHMGQNVAEGYGSVPEAVEGWYSEVNDFEYGVGNTSLKTVGHYTQVVGYRAVRVGCGHASCTGADSDKYQVCNYAIGQMTADLKKPYKEGTSCSDCPSGKCDGNLCYCDGKVCLNGGTLVSTTCTCTCPVTHNGDTCQQLVPVDCPVSDSGMCNTAELPAIYCGGDWMLENCPIKCGRCPKPTGCTKECTNGGVLRANCNCECLPDYSGDTCETLTCPSTPTSPICSAVSQQGTSICGAWNVKYRCPSLCGLCTP